jgi:hypothetical protein
VPWAKAAARRRLDGCPPDRAASSPGNVAVFTWQRFSTGGVDKGVRNAGAPVVKGGDYLCESGGGGRAELRNVLCISIRDCG